MEKYVLRRHIRFGTEVTGAAFDEAAGRWEISLRGTQGGSETVTAAV